MSSSIKKVKNINKLLTSIHKMQKKMCKNRKKFKKNINKKLKRIKSLFSEKKFDDAIKKSRYMYQMILRHRRSNK